MFRSSFLFAQPSFLEGIARIFDFSNSLPEYNFSDLVIEADSWAITNDWMSVYEDVDSSFKIISKLIDSDKEQ